MTDDASIRSDRRIIVVTGASRGIGRSVALRLGNEKNHIVALARSVAALETLDDRITAGGGSATLVPLDLRDSEMIEVLADVLFERFARLDGLFAAAGVLGPLGPLQTASPSAFETTMTVNLFANWRLIRALDPLLRASGRGRAVFVTSSVARRPDAYWGVHAASKAALEAMVMAYALETRQSSLCVNLFDPGPTRTAMRAQAMPGENPKSLPDPDEIAKKAVKALSPTWTKHGQRLTFSLSAKKPT